MTCETEMYVHYVMTAQDLFSKVNSKMSKLKKSELLGLLNEAMRNLDLAQNHGAPKETLKELRNLINDKFIQIVDNDKNV